MLDSRAHTHEHTLHVAYVNNKIAQSNYIVRKQYAGNEPKIKKKNNKLFPMKKLVVFILSIRSATITLLLRTQNNHRFDSDLTATAYQS